MAQKISLGINQNLTINGALPSDYGVLKTFLINDAALINEFVATCQGVLATATDLDYVGIVNEDGIHIVNKTTLIGLKVVKDANGNYKYEAPTGTFANNSTLLAAASVIETVVNKAYAKFDGVNYSGDQASTSLLLTSATLSANLTGATVEVVSAIAGAYKIAYTAATKTFQLNSGVATKAYLDGNLTLADEAGNTITLELTIASLPVGNVTAYAIVAPTETRVVQPTNVTGVTLIDPIGPIGDYDLVYTAVGQTLAWDGGTALAAPVSGVLKLTGTSGNFITAIVSIADLPVGNQSDLALSVTGGTLAPNATFGNKAKLFDIGNLI